jgi:hypothetical protein
MRQLEARLLKRAPLDLVFGRNRIGLVQILKRTPFNTEKDDVGYWLCRAGGV